MRQVIISRTLMLAAAGLAALAIAATLTALSTRPAVAQGPDEKAEIEQRYQREKLVPARAKGDPAKGGPTVIQTNPPAPTGIIDTTGAPFPSSQFRASNRWQAYVGDHLIAVVAGGPPDLTVGRLAVITFSKDGAAVISVRWVDLPGRPGRARVASVQGNTLTIETTGGTRFGFDPTLLQLTAIP